MESTTILLVEDEQADAVLTLRALKRINTGNKIFVVRDGVDALDFLFCSNQHADRDPRDMPRLIILDINLPTVDGLEVLRRVRADERTRHMPIMMLSSSNEPEHVAESYKHGANLYVHKSIDFNQFMEKMRKLCMYWPILNSSAPKAS